MDISTGLILLVVGVLGCAGCIAGIVIFHAKWEKRREAMLKWIEEEDV